MHNQAAPVEPIKEKGYLETVEEKGAEEEEVVDAVGQTNTELVLFESNKHDAEVTTLVNSLNELLLDNKETTVKTAMATRRTHPHQHFATTPTRRRRSTYTNAKRLGSTYAYHNGCHGKKAKSSPCGSISHA